MYLTLACSYAAIRGDAMSDLGQFCTDRVRKTCVEYVVVKCNCNLELENLIVTENIT